MLEEWVDYCLEYSRRKADFYCGCRKIIQNRTLVFKEYTDELVMADCGFTKSKMTMLTKNYLHEESRDVARQLWDLRRSKNKYGSVGFTCYAHFVKGGSIDAPRSKRASVFGPCIQSVTITWLSKTEYCVDIFYRTTELFKKFPADLVFLRDVLLEPFNFEGMKLRQINAHFANITIHPMYCITWMPHLEDPIAELERIKKRDEYFWLWIIKWSARYICPEHHRGIAKFAQALRVHKDANERIDPAMLKKLQKYIRDNYPERKAYKGTNEAPGGYVEDDDDDTSE